MSEWTSSDRRLRRAHVLAAESEVGTGLLKALLVEKLKGQARLVERFVELAPTGGDPQGAILAQIPTIESAECVRELRVAESIAGRQYWQAFARVPIAFESGWRRSVPDHWHAAGPRTSRLDRKRAKRALTPAHAMLNYLYAILESEGDDRGSAHGIRSDSRADARRQALSGIARVGPDGAGEACCR